MPIRMRFGGVCCSPSALAQQRQHDNKARKAGHHQHHRRQQTDEGHQNQHLDFDAVLLSVAVGDHVKQRNIAAPGQRHRRKRQQPKAQRQLSAAFHGASR